MGRKELTCDHQAIRFEKHEAEYNQRYFYLASKSASVQRHYMKTKQVIEAARRLSKPYRVTNGKKFRLKDVDPGDTGELKSEDKPRAKEALQNGVEALAELQDMLYAQDRWSVLLVFQAMDAAGKDGTIKHVMSGVNPQGCQVSSFKAPTSVDLDHDYLWRCMKELPERGRIGIFNRSYYEETLVVRVHPEFLAGQKLPERMRDEEHLGRALSGHPRVRALPHAQRNDRAEIFPPRLEERSRRSAFSSGSTAGEELEVLRHRREGARLLGRLHGGVRGDDPRDGDGGFAVVCGAGGQQMVHARGRGRGGDRCAGFAGFALSESQRGEGARNSPKRGRLCSRANERDGRERRCASAAEPLARDYAAVRWLRNYQPALVSRGPRRGHHARGVSAARGARRCLARQSAARGRALRLLVWRAGLLAVLQFAAHRRSRSRPPSRCSIGASLGEMAGGDTTRGSARWRRARRCWWR